jgi:spermidine synthase
MQAQAPERQREALTYFHSTGPFGQAWRTLPSASRGRSIAVVGLGAGTLASYATPDQAWTFLEIDPAIERIARNTDWFTFLPGCGTRCTVVTGDARISFASMREHGFDLIVLDAFSSDSIPLHLMTREAMDLYLSRLAPGGSIIMHISNRHLRLAPIVGRLAADRGLHAVRRLEASGKDWPEGKSGSEWVAMSRNPADIAPLVTNNGWTPLAPSPSTPLWTDDFSNILSVLVR